jgi:hypothetical protein
MPVDPLGTRLFPPFAVQAPPVFWMMNPFTEGQIDALAADRRFKDLAVAVIDLSLRTRRPDGVGWITSGGWNMYDQRFVASLAKIAAMFAAYRLRENVRAAAREVAAANGKELLETITRDWKGVVETAIPSGTPDFPKLDQIFMVFGGTGGWVIHFTDLFSHHMRQMIEHSNNGSAAHCINAIGFQYLNGALEAEGLYEPTRGGLWLGANYGGRNWKIEPLSRRTHMGATAKSVAHFLTLLEDSRLVSEAASHEMRGLMRLAGTWFGEGLGKARPPRPIADIYGKVGLMGTLHDCAVIERSVGGRRIRYAAVALTAKSAATLHQLTVKLDDYVSSGP